MADRHFFFALGAAFVRRSFGLRGFSWLLATGLWAVSSAGHAVLPIEHWTTTHGARVVFVRAETIPMLDINVDFDAGARRDPAAKSGLAAVVAAMLARGADGLDEAAIAEGFADLGAIRGGGAGNDRASASLRTLSQVSERDRAVDLMARALARPSFPGQLLERERERIVQGLKESLVRPETLARRRFETLLYPDHPYGRQPSVESVMAVTREDLIGFHRTHYQARGAVVSMIGAITRAEAEAIAERLTRDLPMGDAPAALPEVRLPEATEVRLPHPASQSHLLLGLPALARGDPDYFALFVGNHILGGGGFVSRLTTEIREKRGLSYSVYSYFSPMAQPGPFTIGLQTRKEQTDTALSVVRETFATFVREGPTAAELEAARDGLVGGFALRIDNNRKILEHLAVIGWYGLPLDYLERWTDEVARVTVEQIREAFSRRVPPERLVTVVVGAP